MEKERDGNKVVVLGVNVKLFFFFVELRENLRGGYVSESYVGMVMGFL